MYCTIEESNQDIASGVETHHVTASSSLLLPHCACVLHAPTGMHSLRPIRSNYYWSCYVTDSKVVLPCTSVLHMKNSSYRVTSTVERDFGMGSNLVVVVQGAYSLAIAQINT